VSATIADQDVQFLTFIVAGKLFALEVERIVEIIEFRKPTKTPRRPPFVEGLIEHRSQVVPLVSVRKRLGASEGETGVEPVILLFSPSPSQRAIGLLVDSVGKVITIARMAILKPSSQVLGIRAEFMRGIADLEGRPVIWLDGAKLLSLEQEATLAV